MEPKIDMEHLPLEVHGHIAQYLKVSEISACCATSASMREAFNDDFIWKRLCDLQLIDYLKHTDPLIKPQFDCIEDENNTLSPITKWKKLYMMQVRLFNNWRSGKYASERFEFGTDGKVYRNTEVAFYDSDYLFSHTISIGTQEDVSFHEVWDVKTSPFLLSHLNAGLSHEIVHIFQTVGNKLVIAENNLVMIYDISLTSFSEFKRDHVFFFDESRKLPDFGIKSHKDFVESRKYGVLYTSIVCGKYFIGNLITNGPITTPTMHIWDIETGEKVKEFAPTKDCLITHLNFFSSPDGKDVIMKLCMWKNRYSYHYYGFDLATLESSLFIMKLNYCDFQVLAQNRVVGVGSRRLYVYNYETCEKMLLRKTNHEILKATVTAVGGNVLFGTCDNVIHVIDLVTLELINTVVLQHTLYSLKSVCNKFVVVNATNSEVWEIGKTSRQLFRFPCDGSFVSINQSNTKLVISKGNNLIILHFW